MTASEVVARAPLAAWVGWSLFATVVGVLAIWAVRGWLIRSWEPGDDDHDKWRE